MPVAAELAVTVPAAVVPDEAGGRSVGLVDLAQVVTAHKVETKGRANTNLKAPL